MPESRILMALTSAMPITTGRLESRGVDGVSVAELQTGRSYFRSAGVEHDVRNANAFEFVFIEIKAEGAGLVP